MTRRIFKVVLLIGALVLVGAVGIYIDAKPYQRERIWISVHDALVGSSSSRARH
jgi:hypothetical protein